MALALAGCGREPSALNPAGEEASSIHVLFLVTVAGAAVIWISVIGMMIFAFRRNRPKPATEGSQALILWGGAVFPTVVLAVLLGVTLWLMPGIRPWHDAASSTHRVEITGEQYWWRVRYVDGQGRTLFETANEVLLPLGEPTTFSLVARDVIHSFWIPALGGKMDMIPGRTNMLTLTPTRPGVYRGPCAEFCGTSHALMTISARVVERVEFDQWMAARQAGKVVDRDSEGARLFVRHGCPACHGVDGIDGGGTVGPDLTALGERQSVAAGALRNTPGNIARFIRDPAAVKPGATMPAFGMLAESDIRTIAEWLGGLR